jgi:hypothetical protein
MFLRLPVGFIRIHARAFASAGAQDQAEANEQERSTAPSCAENGLKAECVLHL